MKTCTKCAGEFAVSFFFRDAAAKDGRRPQCKACCKEWISKNRDGARAASARYQAKHPDRVHAMERKHRLKRVYGLSVEAYDAMVQAQKGLCAICGLSVAILVVDHCHETGRVRGLLCHNCNSGIGKLRDDPDMLLNAWRYLLKY